MEEEVVREHRPQDDVPEDVIIHYIVKDYRRMFLQEQDFIKRIEIHNRTNKNLREKVRELIRNLKMRQVANIPDDKLRIMIQGLQKKADAYDALKEENEKLQAQIEEVKASRRNVVESVTCDLEEKLKEANRRIELLAQAVVEPEEASSIFLHQCKVHTIETDDDKKWMAGAMKQLEKAGIALLTTEERLMKYEEKLKESGNEYTEKVIKPLGRAISSINKTLSHIECFFDKVGDIKIIEDD